MFLTLLIKEMHETIINLRFLVAALLCVVLIPLGFWMTLREYDNRVKNYTESRQLYTERSEGKIAQNFQAEGYRPPSPLVMLSSGLEYYLPNKAVTSNNGKVTIYDDAGLDNPVSLFFGKFDFQFIVSMILSLMALMFMFDSISGEREQGTLKLMAANPIKRWMLITAKICGNGLVFLMPFAVALVSVLLIVSLSGTIGLNDGVVLPGLVTGFFISVLFLLAMFCLGALVSALMGRAITSLVILLVIWTMFVLVIPKLSPMIAEVIHPIKSQQVWSLERRKAEETLAAERDKQLTELYERIMSENGMTPNNMWQAAAGGRQKSWDQYDKEKVPIESDYAGRIATTLKAIDMDYANDRRTQIAIARGVSRLSPVSCLAFALSDIAGTGLPAIDNWNTAAERFQDKVAGEVYDNFIVKKYSGRSGTSMMVNTKDGYDQKKATVPQMDDYRPVRLSEALRMAWVDITILSLYTVLFFAGAFVAFLRYDVR